MIVQVKCFQLCSFGFESDQVDISCGFLLIVFVKLYTKCGRRAMPTMMMGSAAVFIDCDECWKLLLVTKKGSVYLWDLFNRSCLLQDSLASLISADPTASSKDAGKHKIYSSYHLNVVFLSKAEK